MSISSTIISFYNQIIADEYHRYKSWEHCYRYFHECKKKDSEHGALQLAFYLASWGMYRGSSYLLWKDYKIHCELIENIYRERSKIHDYSEENDDSNAEYILSLVDIIREYYKERITSVNGEPRTVRASNTLATKIILGFNGLVPAFDRFFMDGLKLTAGFDRHTANSTTLKQIFAFYRKNGAEFDKAAKHIESHGGIAYPPMKMVDMYFWQIGFQKSERAKKKKESTK